MCEGVAVCMCVRARACVCVCVQARVVCVFECVFGYKHVFIHMREFACENVGGGGGGLVCVWLGVCVCVFFITTATFKYL